MIMDLIPTVIAFVAVFNWIRSTVPNAYVVVDVKGEIVV